MLLFFQRFTGRRATYLFGLCLAICGCATPGSARYVYQDGEFGVIGIPRNSFMGKPDYKTQAEELMARHFPDGYEIVRAEEVVEGQRILDVGRKTEIGAEPALSLASQMFKLGKLDRSTTYQEKDQVQLRECRIIYKRKSTGPSTMPSQFAAVATLTPKLYVNPNDEMCIHASKSALSKADQDPKKPVDSDVAKASNASSK